MQISLIEFSVENYKIFKDRVTFSMFARKNDGHTFNSNRENLLKTSLIYGPNASGKSSLLEAVNTFRGVILTSGDLTKTLSYTPFIFCDETKDKPTFFEVALSFGNKKIFKYSFSYNALTILTESLKEISSNGNEVPLFNRINHQITLENSFKDESNLNKELANQVEKDKKNALFLTLSAQMGGLSADIVKSIYESFNVINATENGSGYKDYTARKFKDNESFRDTILKYLKNADFSIVGGRAEVHQKAETSVGERIRIFFSHPVFNSKKEKVDDRDLAYVDESVGTKKFFDVLGPVVDTLKGGRVLFIDEFDNSLHPVLTKFIVKLFESEETNKNNAQLIVTTHDTSLLSCKDEFIKDQFWFTEKDKFGAGRLFSLAEFELRNSTEFSKKYLEGRFGALPIIGDFKE